MLKKSRVFLVVWEQFISKILRRHRTGKSQVQCRVTKRYLGGFGFVGVNVCEEVFRCCCDSWGDYNASVFEATVFVLVLNI